MRFTCHGLWYEEVWNSLLSLPVHWSFSHGVSSSAMKCLPPFLFSYSTVSVWSDDVVVKLCWHQARYWHSKYWHNYVISFFFLQLQLLSHVFFICVWLNLGMVQRNVPVCVQRSRGDNVGLRKKCEGGSGEEKVPWTSKLIFGSLISEKEQSCDLGFGFSN